MFEEIANGEYLINGFRNKNIREKIYGNGFSKEEIKKQSGKITRYLWLFRAHGLIKKNANSHSYQLTPKGRKIISTILSYKSATVGKLKEAA